MAYRFLWMEDIIADYLSDLFPGMAIMREAFPFRIIAQCRYRL